jgi:AcrR family transcriptional regulator
MTRPRSGDKRNAILAAATNIIAEQGLSAPTAKIAQVAGVADGSLFTYFPNKNDLLNQLYLELKADMRKRMTSSYPTAGSLKQRARHVWNSYVDWGISFPAKRRAMAQLSVSDRVTEKSRQAGTEGFDDATSVMQQIAARGGLRDRPSAFTSSIMLSLAETTMDFISRYPKEASRYRDAGFEAFWNAAAKK